MKFSLLEIFVETFCYFLLNRCGYNGFPRGCGDDALPWAKKSPTNDPLETKYAYVCHAEMNAIMNKFRGREERDHVCDHVSVQRVREVDDSSWDQRGRVLRREIEE